MAFVMGKKYSVTFWSIWGLILAAVLVACSKDDEGGVVVKDDQVTGIGVWPHPGTGRLIRVMTTCFRRLSLTGAAMRKRLSDNEAADRQSGFQCSLKSLTQSRRGATASEWRGA